MTMPCELVDTHAHLDFPDLAADCDAVVAAAREAGVRYIINIGASLERSRESVALAGRYECVFAVVGIHPHEADSFTGDQAAQLKALAADKKVIGIGEIGLDYHRDFSRRDNQLRMFGALAALGRELGLPLVIHTREAGSDTLKVLKDAGPVRAVVHCFSGDRAFLEECLGLGFFISYTCNITYAKAAGLREMVKLTPLDRLLLETDAPFLPPEGFRGKRNEPSFVALLAEYAAGIRGISVAEVAEATTRNARAFFGLP